MPRQRGQSPQTPPGPWVWIAYSDCGEARVNSRTGKPLGVRQPAHRRGRGDARAGAYPLVAKATPQWWASCPGRSVPCPAWSAQLYRPEAQLGEQPRQGKVAGSSPAWHDRQVRQRVIGSDGCRRSLPKREWPSARSATGTHSRPRAPEATDYSLPVRSQHNARSSYGSIAQSGERLPCTQEARGAKPLRSTTDAV